MNEYYTYKEVEEFKPYDADTLIHYLNPINKAQNCYHHASYCNWYKDAIFN
jgi:hypothetical protein